ncbi:polysaccharide deacetylase family protein [Crocosphaera sp. UHCC 0190]|uniref:polysaccharide deacetylase family protein n=1 Tax=Crocosphaera sp. UHCC 0190 TaxID=3110246 RepID=UPI002B1F072D|nr:polysaccharide deacetylase family protein [Crocosphaera sp. UHCC 0190]MEA5511067.1 polysaccharide deacetylase family protein [Crocosphaera sp. UHCC 0190]
MKLLNGRKYLIQGVLIVVIVILISLIIIQQVTFQVPVFALHGIIDREQPKKWPSRANYLDYTIQDLETFLEKLIQDNYWFLSSQELYDYFIIKSQPIPSEKQNNKPILLTFDDGYKSLNVYLIPLLEKLEKKHNVSLKVVLFINPKFMEESESRGKVKYLNCDDLREGINQGFYDIQSHGLTHRTLKGLDNKVLTTELIESQKILQNCTADLPQNDTIAIHFAYPYNQLDEQVETETAKYYLSGYGYNSKLRNFLFMPNKMRIPRIGVSHDDSPETLFKLAKFVN